MNLSLKTLLCLCAAIVLPAAAQQKLAPAPDVRVQSTPQNVVWGFIPSKFPPIMRVKQGQIVEIDTVSHQGMMLPKVDPVAFFGKGGIKPDEVLKDVTDIYGAVLRGPNAAAHVLTGPIYIEGAEPGDMLEIRVIDIKHRVPYGANTTTKGFGELPELLSEPAFRIIRLDLERKVAMFSPEIEVPLAPFMGIMAVAPPPTVESVSSRPPGNLGGNMDLKQLTRGATLYLPVFNQGALFFTGDAHAAQGDGEVDGTAIEASLTPTFQFFVHKAKGKNMKWPRAETPTHYIAMGIDMDLNVALKAATQETVDFRIAEAVNLNQMVYGMIPKNLS